MINLLPPAFREKEVRRIRAVRMDVGARLAAAFAIVSAALLLPFVFLAQGVRSESEAEIIVLRAGEPVRSGGRSAEDIVADTNTLIDISGALSPDIVPLSRTMRHIAEHGAVGIVLRSIIISRSDGVEIRGIARDRSALLALVASYRSNTVFTRVESPISNLVQDEKIPFVLNLTVGE